MGRIRTAREHARHWLFDPPEGPVLDEDEGWWPGWHLPLAAVTVVAVLSLLGALRRRSRGTKQEAR